MSQFSDKFTEASGKLFDVMGDQVTYKPLRGSDSTVTIIYNELIGAFDTKQNANFHFIKSEIPNPQRGDYVVLNSKRWIFDDIRDSEDGTLEVKCSRPERTG